MRLTSARAKGSLGEAFDAVIDRVAGELDAARADARGVRGEARHALLARLAALDAELLQRSARSCSTNRPRQRICARGRRGAGAVSQRHERRRLRARPRSRDRPPRARASRLADRCVYVMLTSGQTLSLTIEKPAAGGRMIARADGQVVLVSGAIPGERVRARIERVGKGVAYRAKRSRLKSRRPIAANLRPTRFAADVSSRTSRMRGSWTSRVRSSRTPSRGSAAWRCLLPSGRAAHREDGYRMRARLHVRGHQLGFFREGTARGVRRAADTTAAARDYRRARSAGRRHSLARRSTRFAKSSSRRTSMRRERVVALEAVGALAAESAERLAATEGLTGLTAPARDLRPRVRHRPAHAGRWRFSCVAPPRAGVLPGQPLSRSALGRARRRAGPRRRRAARSLCRRGAVFGQRGRRAWRRGHGGRGRCSCRFRPGGERRCVRRLGHGGASAGRDCLWRRARSRPGRPVTVIVDPPRTGMSRDALSGAVAASAPRRSSTSPATWPRSPATRGSSSMPATRSTASDRVRSVPEHAARRKVVVFVKAVEDLGVRVCGFDEALEQRTELAGAPEVLRMPLDAEAERARRILDRFDHPVGRGRRHA